MHSLPVQIPPREEPEVDWDDDFEIIAEVDIDVESVRSPPVCAG